MKISLLKVLGKSGVERDNFLQAKYVLLFSFLLLNIGKFKAIPFSLGVHCIYLLVSKQ